MKSIFSEKTWDKTPWWKEQLCTKESPLQEHGWGAELWKVSESPSVSHKLNVVLVVYLSDTPCLMPAFPNTLPVTSFFEIWTVLARQLFRNILWSSLKICNREMNFFFWRSVQDMSQCVAVAGKQQIQRYMLCSCLQNQARRVWGVGWSLYLQTALWKESGWEWGQWSPKLYVKRGLKKQG